MARVGIDTPALAQKLRDKAGFSGEHAEETARAISEAFDDEVATRSDLDALRADFHAEMGELRGDLRTEMTALRGELRTDMAAMKSELTRLVLTVATGQIALLLAAVFSLQRFAR